MWESNVEKFRLAGTLSYSFLTCWNKHDLITSVENDDRIYQNLTLFSGEKALARGSTNELMRLGLCVVISSSLFIFM